MVLEEKTTLSFLNMIQRWISLLLCLTVGLTAVACSTTESSVSSSVEYEGPTATAIFAGGCFWCMEKPFDELTGVLDTTSGYTGGTVENPSYEQVSSGGTGHIESVQVTYDPTEVSYEELLDVFWRNVDPVDNRGQFCDKGSQYRSAIFYQDEAQQSAASESKAALASSAQFEQEIATDIRPAEIFYPAEDYHQNYYETHPVRYKAYRFACGRDQRLETLWGDEPT